MPRRGPERRSNPHLPRVDYRWRIEFRGFVAHLALSRRQCALRSWVQPSPDGAWLGSFASKLPRPAQSANLAKNEIGSVGAAHLNAELNSRFPRRPILS